MKLTKSKVARDKHHTVHISPFMLMTKLQNK